MKSLQPEFKAELEQIAKELQASEKLQQYLENEEEEDYMELRSTFEPRINDLYERVAADHPLELYALEKEILNPELEGLYLAKILGYSVLRGVVNDNYKYLRPQSHYQDILLTICNSSNFDLIRKRIGQTIQMGFALSSDIWVTNLINAIANKRIRYFLQSQKLPRYREAGERKIGYARYLNQFRNDNFYSTEFPTDLPGLKTLFPSVRQFINYRIKKKSNHTNYIADIKQFLDNELFMQQPEYLELLALYANFFDLEKADQAHLMTAFNNARKNNEEFDIKWMENLYALHTSELVIDAAADQRVSIILDRSIDDELKKYYDLTDIIHTKGYLHDDTIEAVRVYYHSHQGLSIQNECLRQTILRYFTRFLGNLETSDYPEYFELSKIFPTYINIFGNQQFNQDLKEYCMKYVKKLLKVYTDKRGKDYQDIKKFVSATFLDLGFMKEKELVELFKTRRKKKVAS